MNRIMTEILASRAARDHDAVDARLLAEGLFLPWADEGSG